MQSDFYQSKSNLFGWQIFSYGRMLRQFIQTCATNLLGPNSHSILQEIPRRVLLNGRKWNTEDVRVKAPATRVSNVNQAVFSATVRAAFSEWFLVICIGQIIEQQFHICEFFWCRPKIWVLASTELFYIILGCILLHDNLKYAQHIIYSLTNLIEFVS